VIAQTSVTTQQSSDVQQGANSSGNKVQLALNVATNNQGTATSGSGDATATGQVGSTSFSASVTSSAAPSASAAARPAPSAGPAAQTVNATAPPAQSVSVTATTSAAATSGGASAVGVNAQTSISGNQAIVIHIPANTSGHTVQISLDALVSNTGTAVSNTGAVQSTALLGNTALAPAGPAIVTTAPVAGTAPQAAAPQQIDVRNANYALADTGDAVAIGVKADTTINGVQRVLVIIDDNSSGNRIVITFHVAVINTGTAEAISGNAAATGSNGELALAGPAGSGSLTLDNTAGANSGMASAIGVQTRTFVNTVQDVELLVGRNSNDNEVDVSFDASVSNLGRANAKTGAAMATANIGDPQPLAGTSTSSLTSLSRTVTARGVSGGADATGVNSQTNLDEQQQVDITVANSSPLPIVVTQRDQVINLGLARSETGAVTVLAQVVPPPDPTPKPEKPAPDSSPSAAPVSSASPVAAPMYRVADPPAFHVTLVPSLLPVSLDPAQPVSAVQSATLSAPQGPPQTSTAGLQTARGTSGAQPSGQLAGRRIGAGSASSVRSVPQPRLPSQFAMVLVAPGDLSTHPRSAAGLLPATGKGAQIDPPRGPVWPGVPALPLAAAIPGLVAVARGRWTAQRDAATTSRGVLGDPPSESARKD
jgi:hypothetical protein